MKAFIFPKFTSANEARFKEGQSQSSCDAFNKFVSICGIFAFSRGLIYLVSGLDDFIIRFQMAMVLISLSFFLFLFRIVSSYLLLKKKEKAVEIIHQGGFLLIYCLIIMQIKMINDDFSRGYTCSVFVVILIYHCIYCIRSFKKSVLVLVVFGGLFFGIFNLSINLLMECLVKYGFIFLFTCVFVYRHEYEQREQFSLRDEKEKNNELYVDFLNSLKDPILILSKINGIIFKNESASEFFPSSVRFHQQMQKIVDIDGKNLLHYIELAFHCYGGNGGYSISDRSFSIPADEPLNRKPKKCFTVSILGTKLFGENGTVALLIRDITEKIQLEEAKLMEKYKNLIFCTISHELRTPLNGILGILNIIAPEINGICQRFVQKALSSSRMLNYKISDILDFAQLNENDFKLHLKNFNLNDLVQLVKNTFVPFIEEKQIDFHISVDNSLPPMIQGDFDRILQVIFNLLDNAIKFTQKGEITFQIIDKYNGQIKFRIEDTGIGMNDSQVESLFGIFNQYSIQVKKNHQAASLAGLGLTVSKMICRSMGSVLEVKSQKNVGTSFSFIISNNGRLEPNILSESFIEEYKQMGNQIVESQEEVKIIEENSDSEFSTLFRESELISPPIKSIYQMDSDKILKSLERLQYPIFPTPKNEKIIIIVDDNELNRFVLSSLISRHSKYNSVKAVNGQDAIEQCMTQYNQRKKIMILMDLEMPTKDGITASKEIRQIIPNSYPLLIIAVTAYGAEQERQKCKEAGMNDFVIKPMDVEKVKYVLHLFDKLI